MSSTGAQANGRSVVDAISPDGRFVLFDSWATTLVNGDTNGVRDVFLRDRELGRTIRVSVGPGGRQANGASFGATVSSDGRFVLFTSRATNLTHQSDRNRNTDLFVRNRLRAKTFRVSIRPRGGQFPSDRFFGPIPGGISDNGRWVAFAYYVAYPGDGTNTEWIYLRDRNHNLTRRLTPAGVPENPVAFSADGRWLTYTWAESDHPLDPYWSAMRDLWAHHRVDVKAPGATLAMFVTPDARYIAYTSGNTTWFDTNAYRYDRITGTNVRVVDHSNDQDHTLDPAGISSDGRYITVISDTPNLIAGDTNRRTDIFRYDLATHTVIRVDLTSTGNQIPGGVSGGGPITADGRWAAFDSRDGTIVPDDTNGTTDVFVRGPLPSTSTGR